MAEQKYPPGQHPNSRAALARGRVKGAAKPGNSRAVTHRLGTRLAVNHPPDVQEVYEALAASAPVRDAEGDLPAYDVAAVELIALRLAKIRYGHAWVDEHGWFDAEGELRPIVSSLAQWERQLTEQLDRMGMTAAGRARLGLDLARTTDLATAMSEPNDEKRAELLRQAGVVDSTAEEVEDDG